MLDTQEVADSSSADPTGVIQAADGIFADHNRAGGQISKDAASDVDHWPYLNSPQHAAVFYVDENGPEEEANSFLAANIAFR